MTTDSSTASTTNARTGWDRVLLTLLALFSGIAAASIGYVVGWMTGASNSPVGHITIPTVAGIIAALGAHEVLQGKLKSRDEIAKAMSVPLMIFIFSVCVYFGVNHGSETRPSSEYKSIYEIVGPRWDQSDLMLVADVHAFRMRAGLADMPPDDYEQFMVDVVAPIINGDDGKDKKLERMNAALATMEAAFPKPETKVDEKPMPKPAEPATEPAGE